MPSLAAIKSKIETGPELKEKKSEESSRMPVEHEVFTFADLTAAWHEFKATQKENDKDKIVALLNQEFELADNVVMIKCTNDVFTIIFDEIKSELLTYLRKTLHNSAIKLDIKTMEADKTKMIYTNREKFELLREKHPLLNKLKDKLGLDTDF